MYDAIWRTKFTVSGNAEDVERLEIMAWNGERYSLQVLWNNNAVSSQFERCTEANAHDDWIKTFASRKEVTSPLKCVGSESAKINCALSGRY